MGIWETSHFKVLACEGQMGYPPPSISDGGEQMRVSYALLKHLQLTAVN